MRWLAVTLMTAALWATPEKKPPKKAEAPAAKPQTTITGCLDQRGERYVLSSEADMSKITTLAAKGFSDDNFARYVGHKVTVYGAQNSEAFEVVKIENVSDTCSR